MSKFVAGVPWVFVVAVGMAVVVSWNSSSLQC